MDKEKFFVIYLNNGEWKIGSDVCENQADAFKAFESLSKISKCKICKTIYG